MPQFGHHGIVRHGCHGALSAAQDLAAEVHHGDSHGIPENRDAERIGVVGNDLHLDAELTALAARHALARSQQPPLHEAREQPRDRLLRTFDRLRDLRLGHRAAPQHKPADVALNVAVWLEDVAAEVLHAGGVELLGRWLLQFAQGVGMLCHREIPSRAMMCTVGVYFTECLTRIILGKKGKDRNAYEGFPRQFATNWRLVPRCDASRCRSSCAANLSASPRGKR